jgi:hypothetical protein
MAQMLTYDPDASSLISEIPDRMEMPVNEEIARQALARDPEASQKTVPTGLLKNFQSEKKIDESQMADFSTPIEELMQNEMAGGGSPYGGAPQQPQAPSASRMNAASPEKKKASSGNPFGLTDEQFQAALAGVASVIAFSKPVQSRLRTMVPKFVGETGDVSLTGLAVTALVAALVFYIIKKYVIDRN